jgi:hypothetical protein
MGRATVVLRHLIQSPYIWTSLILTFLFMALALITACRTHLCGVNPVAAFLWAPGDAVLFETRSTVLMWVVSVLFWLLLSTSLALVVYLAIRVRASLDSGKRVRER